MAVVICCERGDDLLNISTGSQVAPPVLRTAPRAEFQAALLAIIEE